MFRPKKATTRLYLNCRQAYYDGNLPDWTAENHQNINNSRYVGQLTRRTLPTTLHSAHRVHLCLEQLSQLTAITLPESINRVVFVTETVGEEVKPVDWKIFTDISEGSAVTIFFYC